MNGAPDYWYQLTAGAAIAVILASVAVIALCFFIVMTLADIRRGVKGVTDRVSILTERVDDVAKQVSHVATEVGSRTTGIMRTVDDIAGSAFQVVEKFAPIAIGVAVLFKIKQMFGRSR